jgi:HEAT repeat protein
VSAFGLSDGGGGLNEEAEYRRSALEALGDGPDATERQLRALADVDWRVRKQAILGLSARPLESESLRQLVVMLGSGASVAERNAAVAVLGTQGLGAVRLIEEALYTFDGDAKKLAAEALGQSGEPSALGCLRRLLDDPDLNVRIAGVEAMAEIGGETPDAVRAVLEQQLAASDPYLTTCVLQAMDRLGIAPNWRSIEPLFELPLLIEPALRVVAKSGALAAAPEYVKALERLRGNSWDCVVRSFAEYAQSGDSALAAARLALQGMTAETTERLVTKIVAGSSQVAGAALALVCVQGTRRGHELALNSLSSDELAADATVALKLCGAAIGPALLEAIAADSDSIVDAVQLLTYLIQRGELAPGALVHLRQLASHESPSVLRAWLAAVELFGVEDDLELAASWVSESPPRAVRRAAMDAVRECARRFPDAIKRAALDVSPKAERAAVVALGMSVAEQPVFGSRAADLAFLMGAASSEFACVRCAAIAALGNQGVHEAVATLSFALHDEADDVRMAAIAGLGQLRDPAGVWLGAAQLLEFALTTGDSGLGLAAFRALSGDVHPAAVAKLVSAVHTSEGWRAVGAAETLVRLQPKGSVFVSQIAQQARAALALRLGQERDPDVTAELRRSLVELAS